MSPKKSLLVATACVAVLTTAQAQLTLIQENFDSYGSSSSTLTGQNGGSGFSGSWSTIGTNGYSPTNLTAGNTGYVNTGLTDSSSGAASNNGHNGGLAGNFSTRAITRPSDTYLNTAGNTIWFSFTINAGSVATGHNAFFKPYGVSGDFFAGLQPFYTGVYSPADNGKFVTGNLGNNDGPAIAASTTYLVIGRITTSDGSASPIPGAGSPGTPDFLDIWYNPSDVSSVGAMGAANLSLNNLDYTWDPTFLTGLSVASRGSNPVLIDSLRLAYGGASTENFNAVITAVPEPSYTAFLVGLGLFVVVMRLRHQWLAA